MEQETFKQRIILAIICCTSAIGGFLFGYDTGVIASAMLYIKTDFTLSIVQEELIIGVISLGAVGGAFAGGPISDIIGR